MKLTIPVLLSAVLFAAAPAGAVRVQFDDANVRPGDVVVPKAETHEGDLGAKGSLTVKGTVTGDCAAFGGPLTVDGRCSGDAAAFAGTATVRGLVGGDLSAFGAPVDVSGRVSGDISSIGGDVTVRSSATVLGSVSVVGGRLRREPGATIHGDISDLSSKDWSFVSDAIARQARRRVGRDWGEEERGTLVSGALLAACLLPLLAALFVPEKIEVVSAAASDDIWRCALIGLGILMGLAPATLALLVTLVGIPFIPVLILLVLAGGVLGLAAFFRTLARRAWRNLGRPEPGTIPAVALGAAIVFVAGVVIRFVPMVGGFLTLCLTVTILAAEVVGLGACWLTRLGSRSHTAS